MLIPLASASPLRLEGIGAGVGGNADEAANSVRKGLQSESKAVDDRVIPARRAEWKPGHIRRTLHRNIILYNGVPCSQVDDFDLNVLVCVSRLSLRLGNDQHS
jgi:hypothetical protein